MKRIVILATVEENKVDELIERVRKVVPEADIQVADVPSAGSGATLAGVA